MQTDIFDEEVEKATEELEAGQDVVVDDLPPELQEQLSTIESLVGMNPGVVETDEYKDLMTKIDEHNSGQADTEDEDEDEEYEEEEEDEEYEDEEEDDEEYEEVEIDDPFGVTVRNKKKKKVEINFDIPEEMEDLLSSKYGIEDAGTFFGSVDSWRTQAQEGSEVKKQLEALSNDISNLPPDLRDSITRWADGEDYTAPFTNGERLDFSEDFENQDIETLVQHYLSDEYDALVNSYEREDISEDDFEDKMDLLARTTRKTFTQEKKALVDERVQYVQKQENLHKDIKESALSSVETLSKTYPNFSRSELSKVRNVLVDGKVDDIFYNPDGTYSEEAAEMVANALYGKKMRDTIVKLAKRQGASEANESIVDSSPKTIRKQRSSNVSKGVSTQAVQHLSTVINDKDPYS